MDKKICNIVTFNCKNVKRSIDCIRQLCSSADIVALQETWLLTDELAYLDTISNEFSSTGISGMDSTTGLIRGRPYGGVAILWRKNMFRDVSVIQCHSSRVCAVKMSISNKSIVVVSVYMPTDDIANLVEFTDCLGSVSAIIDNCAIEYCYVLGDFNAHPTERFYRELLNFCVDYQWTCIDTDLLGLYSDTHTFISDAHGSKRWLDHCLVTKAAVSSVVNCHVKYDVLWSDHFPLMVTCNLQCILIKQPNADVKPNRVIWGERSLDQVKIYSEKCHQKLRLIDFPEDFRQCCEHTCNDPGHMEIIETMYSSIVRALCESAIESKCSGYPGKRGAVVGWGVHVSSAHREARENFLCWLQNDKPIVGPIYDEMREAKRIFKSRLKWCQDHETQIKIDILASHHSKNDFRSFWKHTNKLKGKPGLPVCVDGVSDASAIANLFVSHFSVQSPLGPSRSVLDVETQKEIVTKITAKCITKIIKDMSRGKSPGYDGLSVEHLRFAGPHLSRVLAMLFTFCLGHAYMPSDMIKTIVVPIMKNKTGDMGDKNNYRPISLATVISKVFDSVLNTQLNRFIHIHDNQFGFRAGLSTESAILSVKHAVKYYLDRKTPVYACFLDLSRAFDLVSYDLLWEKLKKVNLPTELTNILKYWYGHQVNSVKWAGAQSGSYGLECGVRQGGLCSPTLFNLYMNELIGELSSMRVGCHIDGVCVNNISYADDMVLLSASICGLKQLVATCEQYAKIHGLTYNVKKSVIMVFGARGEYMEEVPHVKINSVPLIRVSKFTYLGHILTTGLKDDDDIDRERRALCVRANMIARRFARASSEVKRTLFRAYCTSFYTCSLWTNFTQKTYNVLRIQYNNAFRMMMGLARYCSASGMFADARVDCFYAVMRKRCASLVRRVRAGANSIMNMIASRLDCAIIRNCCKVSAGPVSL